MSKPIFITAIPFSGFYESLHDSEFNTALERICETDDSGVDYNADLFALAVDSVDWRAAHNAYAKEYVERFAHEFDIPAMVFESLRSPREYNFETDRIYCEVPAMAMARIFAETPRETLNSVAAEMFTSRSGFISFYSPDVENWGHLETWDHNQYLALINAWVLHKRDGEEFDQWVEHNIMSSAYENGKVDNFLFEGNPEKLNRIDRIASYLREREGR